MATAAGPANPTPSDQQLGEREGADNPTGIDLINQLGYTHQEVGLARSTSLPARFVRLEFETP